MAEITITQENFNSVVLESQLPVLVDFWATWCGPCRMLGPTVEELANEYEGKAVIGKINVDEQPTLAITYHVDVIPTLIAFKNGKVTDRKVGVQPKSALEDMIK